MNRTLISCWAVLIAVACTYPAEPPAVSPAPAPGAQVPRPRAARLDPSALPAPARWIEHVTVELMPFWAAPDALGEPLGNFPTFRCNDGSAYERAAPCPEMRELPDWISRELGIEYTRMKSRQTFVYGVAFHITGDERFLTYARAGVDWLRRHAYERDTGSAISYVQEGVAGPPPAQRTTQDLAYAQLGLAFYYYLTRDPAVLDDMSRLREHIMTTYWEPSWGMLRWVREDPNPGDGDDAARQELVAQLDQINAYLLLVARLIPDGPLARTWNDDLVRLAQVVKERFFAAEQGVFWGVVHDPGEMKLGGRHVDFGHSSKALWMLYLTGQLTGDQALIDFARRHAAPLLARAAQPSGCWASNPRPDGAVDAYSQWWISAELDQTAATFALREDQAEPYSQHLARSYACWLTRFVDREHGGVWPFVPPDWTEQTFATEQPLKVFHWKSGYHAAEHALVALLTTAGLTGQDVTLYYAFAPKSAPRVIQPYYFDGTIVEREHVPLPGHADLHGVRVTFQSIR